MPDMPKDSSTEQSPAPPKAKERIQSLDAFRGFTILGMVFVIAVAAGQYQQEPYADMEYGGLPQVMRWFGSPPVSTWFHAEVGWDLWHEHMLESGATQEEIEGHEYYPLRNIGVTFTDLIAPWFVFIVGVCIPLSRRKRGSEFWWHAITRTLMLILAGMLYISFVIQQLAPWWGVLQAIGVAYFCGVVITLLPSWGRWLAVFAVGFLHLALTELWPEWTQASRWFPEWTGQVWKEIDRPWWTFANPTGSEKRILAIHCLPWLSISYGVMTMIGVLLGEVIKGGTKGIFARRAILLSVIFIPLGYGIHKYGLITGDYSLCMNKPEVTASYAFFTAGTGALTLLVFYWIIDVWKIRGWSRPLLVFGINPLLAYFMMILMRRWLFDRLALTGIFDRVTVDNALVHNWAAWLGSEEQPAAWVLDLFRKSGYHGVMWGLIWTFCLWLIVAYCNRKSLLEALTSGQGNH